MAGSDEWISIRGARTHNLQDVDVDIPRGRFVVVSGVSGSGKSSLAFDTLYAEGQRRYVESLSSYARQFLGQMKKPDCDSIEGLSPAISIDQKQGSHNPRSTVSTVTEIMDHLRLLWARIGTPHCPECGIKVELRTVQEIVDDIMWYFEGHSINAWSPVIRNRKGTHQDLFTSLVEQGYLTGRVNGRDVQFEDAPELEKNLRHDVDVRIDRMRLSRSNRQRLTEAAEAALRLGGGSLAIESFECPKKNTPLTEGSRSLETERGTTKPYSEEFACPKHGSFLPEMSPRIFSFNNPLGACPDCQGLGVQRQFSLDQCVDHHLSVDDGCVRPFRTSMMSGWYKSLMRQTCAHYEIDIHTPFGELDEDAQDILLYGSGSTSIQFEFTSKKGSSYQMYRPWEGVFGRLNRTFTETTSNRTRNRLLSYMTDEPCLACNGTKLNPAVRRVILGGVSLPQFNGASVLEALAITQIWQSGELDDSFWSMLDRSKPDSETVRSTIPLGEREMFIGREVIKEVASRLRFLALVGLDYLTLDRGANTLSGGESQRIRLASQIGTRLTGVMYVLDEPSIGLHSRDNSRLLITLRELCDIGNTLIVVEHDEATLRHADWLVDIGPGAGKEGGRVISSGTLKQLLAQKESITGAYLSGRRKIEIPINRTVPNGQIISIKGARLNNLQNIDVPIPLGCMVAITGVSGSGKSSLITGTLAPALQRDLNGADSVPGPHRSIEGHEHLDKVIVVDQSPIGRTPRSNAATYTGAFGPIRALFSETQLSKERGYAPGRFSFNVRGGRCEACNGGGSTKLEMNFLPDVWVICDVCKGTRYTRETLEVTWKGRTIADVLDMSVAEATEFFANQRKIHRILKTLDDVGLGYIRLGQPATTLSGGEAQRVKLATELHRPTRRPALYILDEPTTGLSMADVDQLIHVLQRIRDNGHTVVIIEHNLDVVKCCDWVIDLGPEGGDGGGTLVASGPPEEIATDQENHTGKYLSILL